MNLTATTSQRWMLFPFGLNRFFCTSLFVFQIAFFLQAQCPDLLISTDCNAPVVDFSGFTGTGFTPNPASGQLCSNNWAITGFSDGNLAFGGTQTAGDFARGNTSGNGVTTGGIYALNSGGNQAIWFQPSSADFNPGSIKLKVCNTSGHTMADLQLAFDLLILNDQGRNTSITFSYSTDNVIYTGVPSMNAQTDDVTGATVQTLNKSILITGINLPDNACFYLLWNTQDISGTGARDEWGLDNIKVCEAICSVTDVVASNPVCNGLDAVFDVSFTTAFSTGNYHVINTANGDILGSGNTSPIQATYPNATGGSISIKVVDDVNIDCVSDPALVNLPDCSIQQPACNLSITGDTPLGCNGYQFSFQVNFTATGGTEDYQIIDDATNQVIGAGTTSPITVTLSGTNDFLYYHMIDTGDPTCNSPGDSIFTVDCCTPAAPTATDIEVCESGNTMIQPNHGNQASAPAAEPLTAIWNFEGSTVAGVVNNPAFGIAGNAARGTGIGNAGFPGGCNSTALAFSGNSWTQPSEAFAVANNDYFEFTLSASNAYTFHLNGLSFYERASATGPTNWAVYLDGANIGNGITHQACNQVTITGLNLLIPQNGSTTVRIYAWGNSNAAGTWRVDGVTLSGNAFALPSNGQVTYNFYNDDPGNGGILLESNALSYDPQTTVADGSETIWVSATNGTCESEAIPVLVRVDEPASAFAGNDTTICDGAILTLNGILGGSASAGTWSNGGGTFVPDNTSITAQYIPSPTEIANKTYTLILSTDDPDGVCGAVSDTIVVTIGDPVGEPDPIAPTIPSCGGTADLSVQGCNNGTVNWYDADTGGNLLATGPNVSIPITSSGFVYAECVVNGCSSSRSSIYVPVFPSPGAPTLFADNTTVCAGDSVHFTAGGGLLYQFLLNGNPVGNVSPDSTYWSNTLNNGDQVSVKSVPTFSYDGNITDAEWGAPVITSAGGPAPGFGSGHEINALYVQGGADSLFIALAGNVQNDNRILLFIDSKAGGYTTGNFGRDGALYGLQNYNSSSVFDPGFEPDYCLTFGTNPGQNNYFADLYTLSGTAGSGGGPNLFLADDQTPGNPFGVSVSSSYTDYTHGFELGLLKSQLGYTGGDLKMMAMYISNTGFLSNQFLSPANSGDGNYGLGQVIFGNAAPNPVSLPEYSLTNPCMPESTPVVITVNPVVSPSITPADAVICGTATGSISLSNLLPNTTYALSYDFGGNTINTTFSTDGTGSYTLANLGAGDYTNIVVSASGCSSQPAAVNIDCATPTYTINDPCVCLNNATTAANDGQFSEIITISAPSGLTWTVTACTGLYANGTTVPANPADLLLGATFTENPAGTYTLTGVHVEGVGYQITATSNLGTSLNIGNTCFYPNGTITGLASTYCETDPAVSVNLSSDQPGTVSVSLDNNLVFGPAATATNYSFDPATAGIGMHTLDFLFDETDNQTPGNHSPGCSQPYQQMVTINQAPIASVPNDITICQGTDVPLNGTLGGSATSGTWIGGAGTFNPDRNTGNATYTPDPAEAGTTVSLTWQSNDPAGPCTFASDVFNISIQLAPTVSAGPDVTICQGGSTQLNGTFGGSATSGSWIGGAGTFNPNRNTGNATYTPGAGETGTTVVLTWQTNDPSGPCNASSDAMTITVNTAPTINAGADVTICEGGTTTLNGTFGGSATSGAWVGGLGAFNPNRNTGNAIYTPAPGETGTTISLTWQSNDPAGPCTPASDAMTITINTAPTINAGPDVTICEGSATTLNGTLGGSATSGTWVNGLGTFTPSRFVGNATYTPALSETGTSVTLQWVSNDPAGPCTAVSDQMVITINPAPKVTVGPDQIICQNQTLPLNAVLSGSATGGSWIGGTGAFTPNRNVTNPVYTPSTGEYGSSFSLIFETNDPSGPCTFGRDTLLVTVNTAPIVFAGNDLTICTTAPINLSSLGASITTNGSGVSNGVWSTNGDGVFSPNNTFAGAITYTPGPNDLTHPFVLLTLTSNDPSGPCGPVSDQVNLWIHVGGAMVCNDNVQISLDGDCSSQVTPDMILEGTYDLAFYTVQLINSQGQSIGNTIGSGQNGMTLTAKVTDICTGNSCWGTISVEDKLPPVINCTNVELSCNHPNDPIPVPQITDCDDISYAYTDQFFDLDCSNPTGGIGAYSARLIRTYIATDASGNSASCTQTVNYLRKPITSVVFPSNITIECSTDWCDDPNGHPTPSSIQNAAQGRPGSPTIDGNTIYPFVMDNATCSTANLYSYCEINTAYNDVVIPVCNGAYKILRTWTAVDWCTGQIISNVQIIKIADTTPPSIACPASVTISTGSSSCFGNANPAAPQVSDACSSNITITKTSSGGTFLSNGVLLNIPLGTATVTYTATDGCNNSKSCTFTITVTDQIVPTPVCDEITQVSLTNDGSAEIFAPSFDDGSHDNCGIDHFEVRRMGSDCVPAGSSFGPSVTFTCCDVHDTVQVIMRVFDVNGNHNDCMVQVYTDDKLPPVAICPANLTIQCDDGYNIWNLEQFGQPTFYDNCSYDTTYIRQWNLDNCHAGTITRSWTVKDPSNNQDQCSQTITVLHHSDFIVDLPEDITFTSCDLGNAGEPQISDDDCELVAVNHTDQVFDIVPDACYKIIRTWTVVNWCIYNPNASNNTNGGIVLNAGQHRYRDDGDGYFHYVQIIKVLDNVAPTITSSCADVTFEDFSGEDDVPGNSDVSESCDGYATLTLAADDACSPLSALKYRWRIYPNGNLNTTPVQGTGADASGEYPYGCHLIKWEVEDGCGNVSYCEYHFTILDKKKPSITCLNGLSSELMWMDTNGDGQGDQGMVTIWDSEFLSSWDDNCTSTAQLKLRIRKSGTGTGAPATKSVTYTCDDIGTQLVELWAGDNASAYCGGTDNWDYCETYVLIQDNNNVCAPQQITLLSGNIMTETQEMVKKVDLQVSSNNPGSQTFTMPVDGIYEVTGVPSGYNYLLTPSKYINPLNGVTTYDLVLITKHILGSQLLNSPYKMIAADANKSGTVTAFDMVEIRKLILHVYDDFPSNSSWRFIDAGFAFPNPSNPWQTDFPEVIEFDNVTAPMTGNFVGVKIGDVNGSVQPENLLGSQERHTNGTLQFKVEDLMIEAGKEYTIPVQSDDWKASGFQFTFDYNPEIMEITGVESAGLKPLSNDNFGWLISDHAVTTSWNGTEGLTGQTAFRLHIRAKTSARLSEALKLNSRITPAEAYLPDGGLMDVSLVYHNAPQTSGIGTKFELYQNQPNPFNQRTSIGFELPESENASLTIYDASGKVLRVIERNFTKGYNEIQLQKTDLPASGILYYQLKTSTDTATKKMILIE